MYSFYQRNQTQVDEEELLQKRSPDTSEDEAEQYSPGHVVCRREPLNLIWNLLDIMITYNSLYY